MPDRNSSHVLRSSTKHTICTTVGFSTGIELGRWGKAWARKADMPELLPLIKCLVRVSTRPILLYLISLLVIILITPDRSSINNARIRPEIGRRIFARGGIIVKHSSRLLFSRSFASPRRPPIVGEPCVNEPKRRRMYNADRFEVS